MRRTNCGRCKCAMSKCPSRVIGFSLVEMAIVIVIITLLLGAVLMPLGTQVEQRSVNATQQSLDEIKEALIGFALAKGRLPGPAQSSIDGKEKGPCTNDADCTGFIPWATLGVSKTDAWNKIIMYSVTPAFTNFVPPGNNAAFTFTTLGTKTIRTRDPSGNKIDLAKNIPVVIFSFGKNNFGTNDEGNTIGNASSTNTDEQSNHTATTTFMSRLFTTNASAPGGEFDDLVAWISPNILFNRMVAAGKLP